SGWIFFWITRLEDLSAVAFGATDVPSVYSNHYPALYAQGAGAAYALAAIVLWGSRRHLSRMLRAAWGGARQTAADEFAPPRASAPARCSPQISPFSTARAGFTSAPRSAA